MRASPALSAAADAPGGCRVPGPMRRVNTSVRERTGAFGRSDPIAFFCECAALSCCAVVWMAGLDFAAKTDDRQGWLLARGHEPPAEPPVVSRQAVTPQSRAAPGPMTAMRLADACSSEPEAMT